MFKTLVMINGDFNGFGTSIFEMCVKFVIEMLMSLPRKAGSSATRRFNQECDRMKGSCQHA